ncbi:MAG: hypothetical protein ACLRZ9_02105 [Eubacterium sp.]
MMDNIEKVLKNLFRRAEIDRIINNEILCYAVKENEFLRMMTNYLGQYSDTELKNMYLYLAESFLPKYYAAEKPDESGTSLNVFGLLKHYSAWLLKIQGDEVVCEYRRMLHWRMITRQLSEDLLVTAFLAQRECKMPIVRGDFGWKPFISHNNAELNKIIKQGVCENHYHLKGSGPIFQLSWISIMNNLISSSFSKRLVEFDKNTRNVNKQYAPDYKNVKLSEIAVQAALIRLYLVSLIMGIRIEIGEYSFITGNMYYSECSIEEYTEQWNRLTTENVYFYLSKPQELVFIKEQIQNQINTIKKTYIDSVYPDYALYGIQNNIEDSRERFALQGERWFLYEMFRRIYAGDPQILPHQNIFYAYIVIKENIRAELIQNNSAVGFENFRIYQDRKEYFLEDSFYQNSLVKEAVQSSIFDSNVVTLEARIAPKNTSGELRNKIIELDEIIDEKKYGNRFFYTVHFIKWGQEKFQKCIAPTYRQYKYRQEFKRQALAIADLREKNPKIAARIRGIDAANTEIGFGPENFAQVFRFLSDHMPKKGNNTLNKLLQLQMSYHVGEDFLDVVSGLRAIDEAINYLNLGCGSRIGHALAMGINIDEWYKLKNYRVIMPKQEYLDNVVWLYKMIQLYKVDNGENVTEYLRDEFVSYYNEIYAEAIKKDKIQTICENALTYYKGSCWEKFYFGDEFDFGIENYFKAWEIRGDSPESYEKGFFDVRSSGYSYANQYDSYFINRKFPLAQEERFIKEVGILYYLYHFDSNVRKNGEKCIEIKVSLRMLKAIEQVQKGMQGKVAKAGIAIETNPSSNCEIGTFRRYDKHPIMQFYNKNLTDKQKELDKCYQINVSINTDNQGVFNVSLENEYAYLALALEKAKDKDGKPLYKRAMIYQWIDDIRKMGIRQTFLNTSEMERALYEWRKEMSSTSTELKT